MALRKRKKVGLDRSFCFCSFGFVLIFPSGELKNVPPMLFFSELVFRAGTVSLGMVSAVDCFETSSKF